MATYAATSRALVDASHIFLPKVRASRTLSSVVTSPALGLCNSSIQGLFRVDADVSDFGYDFREAIFLMEKWCRRAWRMIWIRAV
jgi:hypothetical protein